MHLSDKALLVHLGISQWTARKLDRKASDQVAAANGASNASGRYNKSLLPTYGKLETVTAKTAVIRKKFYHNTLPWGIEGTFILPSANYLPFVTEFRRDKADWQNAVADFFAGYDAAHQQAKLLLGSLYNSADYPTLAQLQAKFSIGLDILPVPTAGDFRVELADEEYDSIRAEVEERVAESSTAAIRDVWQRLYDKVAWLADRLSDPKNTFRNDTYTDARDMCGMLTRLNFTGDANFEQMRAEVEAKLLNHHPEALRNDPDLRRDTAAETKAIMDKMAVFMGGL